MNNTTILAGCLAAAVALSGEVSPAQAADLTLPALPAGCQYTRQALLPVQGTFRVEPGTPLYGVVGPQQTTFLQVSLRCDSPLAVPLKLALKGSGALNWQGPGQDILPTAVRDAGLRVYAQGEATGGTCSPGDWLGAGTGDWQCTLPAGGEGGRTLSLQLAAQVVKTGDNTPVQSTRSLQPETGEIMLAVNDSPVSLTGTGVIAPQLVTPVTCAIENGKNDTINFGDVRRDTSGDYHREGVQLATQAQNIRVRCTPLPDDVSSYSVSLTFSGAISDTYNFVWAQKGALKTSISDLFIIPVDSSGESIPLNGDAVSLSLDPTTQLYGLDVNWWLVGYSATGKAPEEYGAFTANAAYTVEVN
ncbi:fimbrial protein [Salmonella enterica subsp. enterica]|nr:fimbrial protein [Salmonella enterica subsp. enterica]